MYSQKDSTCTLLSGGTYSPNCKRLHVRPTYSAYSTFEIYTCDWSFRLMFLNATNVHLSSCHITCDCLHMRCIFALYLSKSHSLAPVHLLSGIILPDSFWHGRFINAPLLQVFPRAHHQRCAEHGRHRVCGILPNQSTFMAATVSKNTGRLQFLILDCYTLFAAGVHICAVCTVNSQCCNRQTISSLLLSTRGEHWFRSTIRELPDGGKRSACFQCVIFQATNKLFVANA